MANILMVIAPENFRDEELFVPKQMLEEAGHTITVASTTTGTIQGALGGTIDVHTTLEEIDPTTYEVVVFVGGGGCKVLFDNTTAHEIIRKMYEVKKIVAGICLAPVILARAGILEGKKATVWISAQGKIEDKGAIYTDEGVTVDGTIVTASGPDQAEKFGTTLVEMLSQN
jgi:protease I